METKTALVLAALVLAVITALYFIGVSSGGGGGSGGGGSGGNGATPQPAPSVADQLTQLQAAAKECATALQSLVAVTAPPPGMSPSGVAITPSMMDLPDGLPGTVWETWVAGYRGPETVLEDVPALEDWWLAHGGTATPQQGSSAETFDQLVGYVPGAPFWLDATAFSAAMVSFNQAAGRVLERLVVPGCVPTDCAGATCTSCGVLGDLPATSLSSQGWLLAVLGSAASVSTIVGILDASGMNAVLQSIISEYPPGLPSKITTGDVANAISATVNGLVAQCKTSAASVTALSASIFAALT